MEKSFPSWNGDLPALVASWGVPWGQEDAFKLTSRGLLAGRILIGMDIRAWTPEPALQFARELGASPAALAVLLPHLRRANALFIGLEPRADDTVCKLYLEFWDEVRREVRRTGSRQPRLLHLGVKWTTADPSRHWVAQYQCHPLLGTRDVLRRISAVHGNGTPVGDIAATIVRHGMHHTPGAPLLYLEASEEGTPRNSYDVNLYKTGLVVGDVEPQLRHAAAALGADADPRWPHLLQAFAGSLLGHIAGGVDREGGQFLSVYVEVRPLPGDGPA
jgi:hypothetical protein